MNWIGNHLAEVITLIVLSITTLAGYLQMRSDVRSHGERLKETEKTLDDHLASSTLHRTPDFEQCQQEMRADLARMDKKLDRIIELYTRRP